MARSLGVTVALVGAQVPVMDGTHSWLGYLLTLVVVVAGIALYLEPGGVALPGRGRHRGDGARARRSWPTGPGGSLGAVGGVLVAGITLLPWRRSRATACETEATD